MTWQDSIISTGSIIFIMALIPSLVSKEKPPYTTSIVTGGTLLTYGVVYSTLHLWFAALTTTILAIFWLALAAQKFHRARREKKSQV